MKTARLMIAIGMLVCVLLQLVVASPKRSASARSTDWSVAVVESTIKRNPTGESFKGWGYAKALYLYGQYLVYLRTRDKRYLDHIQSWVDQHIDDKGTINRPINSLDYIMPGNLLLILYKETKQEKYKLAAQNVRKVFDTYPRTKDGGSDSRLMQNRRADGQGIAGSDSRSGAVWPKSGDGIPDLR